MPRRKEYKFPADYKVQAIDEETAVIPARPGVWLPILGWDMDGTPLVDGTDTRYHPVYLFLEDIAARKITTLGHARRALGDLARASMMDYSGKYNKAIHAATVAIKAFISTEDLKEFIDRVDEVDKKLAKVRDYLYTQDIGLARAEGARGDAVLDLVVHQSGAGGDE